VAVVDDDAAMKQAIERLLNAAGFRTIGFASAEALLSSEAFATLACLVLDVHLPGRSGFQLQQLLLEEGRSRPVVFVTAFDHPDAAARARAAGAVAYLTKPFQGRSLVAAVSRALGDTSGPP